MYSLKKKAKLELQNDFKPSQTNNAAEFKIMHQ